VRRRLETESNGNIVYYRSGTVVRCCVGVHSPGGSILLGK